MAAFTAVVRRYDALLGALDAAGVLAKLDALHVFATEDEAAARINLADPKRGPLVLGGSGTPPTFAGGEGYTSTGAMQQYLRSPLAVDASGVRYNSQSATMGIVSRTTGGTTVSKDIRLSDVAFVDPYSGASPTQFHSAGNDGIDTGSTLSGLLAPAGFFAWSRLSPGAYAKYWGRGATADLTSATVSTSAVALPMGGNIHVLRGSSHQISAAFFGGGLTQTEMTALYAALKTYLTAVGAWI